jgi:branched-chain amino acid transport system substrate-binding protein
MRPKIYLPVIIGLAIIIAIVGIWISTIKEKEPKVYKIGAILPLTGNLAILGEPEKNGMSLAEEIINQQGGINGRPIKIIFEDSKGQPKEAVSIANKFINIDGIKIIIVSTTGASRAILPIAHTKRVILLAGCMDPTIQNESPYVFRLYESMGQEAETILKYFEKKKRENIKVGILYVNHAGAVQQLNDYFKPGFEKLGINISLAEPFEIGQKDFRSLISKIKYAGITHLIIIGYGFEYPFLFRELKQYDLLGKITILGGWGFIAVRNVPDELLEGVIVAAPTYVFEKNQKALDFIKKYKEKYGTEPNFDAAFFYDNIMIIKEALKLAKTYDPEKIRIALSTMGNYSGVMGEMKISPEGDLKVPMGLGVIKNGKIIRYEF